MKSIYEQKTKSRLVLKRTQDQLKEALSQQIQFLNTSCQAFDNGNESEALRIAGVLRTLLHDTDSSKSLLGQLGIKDKIQFIDSADPIDPTPTDRQHDGRTIFVMSGMPGLFAIRPTMNGTRLVAPLSLKPNAKGSASFESWWMVGCIPGENNARHSREWLIKQMANKEGGAHVDPEINKGYAELRTTGMGMTVSSNGIDGFINSPADVSVRQIAWELLASLQQAKII